MNPVFPEKKDEADISSSDITCRKRVRHKLLSLTAVLINAELDMHFGVRDNLLATLKHAFRMGIWHYSGSLPTFTYTHESS